MSDRTTITEDAEARIARLEAEVSGLRRILRDMLDNDADVMLGSLAATDGDEDERHDRVDEVIGRLRKLAALLEDPSDTGAQ